MKDYEKEELLKMYHQLTETIESTTHVRNTLYDILTKHDPTSIHPEDINLPSKYKLN